MDNNTILPLKTPKVNIADLTNKFKNLINSAGYVKIFLIISIIILLILLIYYIQHQITKKNSLTKTMKSDLEVLNTNNITSINNSNQKFNYNLRDYYVLSSYNSCCNEGFNNSYVDLNALKEVIRKGARFLDFEIYSVDDKTVIAASYNDNYYQKGTYNSIPFDKAMKLIDTYAFSASTSPTFKDPLFLNFRIKSNQPRVYQDMSKILSSIFKNRLLDNKYSYGSNGENITREPLKNFLGKVVLICDKSNEIFTKSSLHKLINIISGTQFLKLYRNYDIEFTHNYQELINSNKKNMSITMPDLSVSNDNINAALHMKYGCQFICMNMQNVDSNLIYYLETFNKEGSAFMLKPEELRFIPKTVDKPAPQKKDLSFANKKIEQPYFKHEI